MLIAICGQKGGAGKTTLAHLVAEDLIGRGFDIELADGDLGQGSLIKTAEQSSVLPTPRAIEPSDYGELGQDKIAILDTPPSLGEAFFSACLAADLVLIPAAIGCHDIRTLQRTVEAAKRARAKVLIVINRVKGRERLSRELIPAIQEIGAPVANTVLRERSAYCRAGQGGWELIPRSTRRVAQGEIFLLVEEIITSLNIAKEIAA